DPGARVLPTEILAPRAELLAVDYDPEPVVLAAGGEKLVQRRDGLRAPVAVNEAAALKYDEILEKRHGEVVVHPADLQVGGVRVRLVGGDGVAGAELAADIPEGAGGVVEDLAVVGARDPPGGPGEEERQEDRRGQGRAERAGPA